MSVGVSVGTGGHDDAGDVPPVYSPSLDYSDARNSQYLGMGF